MKTTTPKAIGWLLILIGALVVLFSNKIVFPGLERVVGIETIVGKENVIYQPDGSYLFTNPAGMARWIISVAAIGILFCLTGIWLLIRARKERRAAPRTSCIGTRGNYASGISAKAVQVQIVKDAKGKK